MDILGLVKEQLTSGTIEKISGFLGEDSTKTTSALTGAIPTLLGGMISKASTPDGAGDLMNMISTGGHDGGILSKFSGLVGGDDTNSLISSGSGILSSLFGDKLNGVTETIAKASGISSGSASSLLGMAAPLLMGVVGGQAKTSSLGVSGLTDLLNSQKDSVSASLPSGLGSILSLAGIGSLLGGAADAAGNVVSGTVDAAKNIVGGAADVAGNVVSGTVDAAKNIVGGAADVAGNVVSGTVDAAKNIVGGAADVAGNIVGGTVDVAKNVVGGAADVAGNIVGGTVDVAKNVAGGAVNLAGDAIDGAANLGKNVLGGAADLAGDVADGASSGIKKLFPWLLSAALAFGALVLWKSCAKPAGDAVEGAATAVDSTASNVVDVVKKTLKSGVELSFGKESIENEMISFIEDKSKAVDKATWFNFRNLNFETASAKIDSTSMQEVKNIVAILNEYPDVNAKIGGYTDNVGDAKSNLKLSIDRANNVMVAITALGIDKARLTAEGYGQEHPIVSNDTEEGKAQNRRIAVNITKK